MMAAEPVSELGCFRMCFQHKLVVEPYSFRYWLNPKAPERYT
jgi:hypothetical protein